jgi:hypothetical protein
MAADFASRWTSAICRSKAAFCSSKWAMDAMKFAPAIGQGPAILSKRLPE